MGDDQMLADGGPDWCYEISKSPTEFGVRKRTNGVLVQDGSVAPEYAQTGGQIDALKSGEWNRGHETEPIRLEPRYFLYPVGDERIIRRAVTGEPSGSPD